MAQTTVDEVRDKLRETDEFHVVEVTFHELEFTTAGNEVVASVPTDDSYPLEEHALRNLGAVLEIPAGYLAKCPPALQIDNIRYWQSRLSDRKRGRFVVHQDRVRAIGSPRFSPVQNLPLFDAIVEILGKDGEPTVETFAHDFVHTHIALSTPTEYSLANPHTDGDTDVVRPGIFIQNSLANAAKLELQPCTHRKLDDGRTILPTVQSQGSDGRRLFRYKNPDDSGPHVDWVTAATKELKNEWAPLLKREDEVSKTKLDEPAEEVLEALMPHIPGFAHEEVQNEYAEDSQPTLWGIASAVSRAAVKLDTIEPHHRLRMDRAAGHLTVDGNCSRCHRQFH